MTKSQLQELNEDWFADERKETPASWEQFKRLMAKMKVNHFLYGEFIELAQLITGYPFEIAYCKKEPHFTYSEANELIKFFDRNADPKAEFTRMKGARLDKLVQTLPSKEVTPSSPISNEESDELEYECYYCKTKYVRELLFCERCGNKLLVQKCPCGHVTTDPNAKFCGKCGTKLGGLKGTQGTIVPLATLSTLPDLKQLGDVLVQINKLASGKGIKPDELVTLFEDHGCVDCEIKGEVVLSSNIEGCHKILKWLSNPNISREQIEEYDWTYDPFADEVDL